MLRRLGDGQEAVQHYLDAHRACPSDLAVLSWLGAHHVRQQDYAGAERFFEAAAHAEPGEPKWALMAAGCLRRLGRAEEAVQRYRKVHAAHPANAECLRYLVQLSQVRAGRPASFWRPPEAYFLPPASGWRDPTRSAAFTLYCNSRSCAGVQDLGLAEDARRYAAEAQRAERLGGAGAGVQEPAATEAR